MSLNIDTTVSTDLTQDALNAQKGYLYELVYSVWRPTEIAAEFIASLVDTLNSETLTDDETIDTLESQFRDEYSADRARGAALDAFVNIKM